MSKVLGLDLSLWQDDNSTSIKTNFIKAKQLGVEFVIIKASQNDYEDQDFRDNWNAAGDAGLLRGAYHFYDYRPGIEKPLYVQANTFLEATKGDFGELGLACDYERPNSTWPLLPPRSKSLDTIYKFMEIVEAETKEDTISYHNLDFVKNHIGYSNIPTWLKQKPLWLARYPYVLFDFLPTTLYLPSGLPWKVYFWQFTDRLDGIKYGAESKQIDGNYWLGTLEALKSFRNRSNVVVPDPVIPPVVEDPIIVNPEPVFQSYLVKVIAPIGLNVREGTGTNFKKVSALRFGETVTILEECDGWGRTSNGWISLVWTKKI